MKTALIAAGAVLAVYAGAAQAETIPERLMRDLQHNFHLLDFQAAGVVGGLARETGNFRYIQEINPLVNGSRGGIGYAQWTGDRRVAFETWASEDADLTSYEVNYGYLAEEFKGPYASVIERLRETEDIEEAATVFMKRYLKPHRKHRNLDERIAYGEAYLAGDFSGAGCQAEHDVEIDGRLMVVALCPTEGLQLSPQEMMLASALREDGITFQFASPYREATPLVFGVPPETFATLHLGEDKEGPGGAVAADQGSVRIMLDARPVSFSPSVLSFPDEIIGKTAARAAASRNADRQDRYGENGAGQEDRAARDVADAGLQTSLRPKARPAPVFGDAPVLASSPRPAPRPWGEEGINPVFAGMETSLRPHPQPDVVKIASNEEDYLSPL